MISLPYQLELQTLFSGFLFETGLSAVSVKNYLSDLRHFFSFCASISSQEYPPTVQEIFQNITKYLNPYLDEQKKSYTPQNTINRRLASIRRFSTFLASKFGLVSKLQDPNIPSNSLNKSTNQDNQSDTDSIPTIKKILDSFKGFLTKEKKTHSTIKNYISDLNHFLAWSANETPFLDQKLENILSESHLNTYVTYLKLSHTSTSVINRRQSSVKQFTKYCFLQKYIPTNPFEYKRDVPKLAPLSWLERLSSSKNIGAKKASGGRFVNWYQKYNSLPFTPYLHLALLVLATSAMVIFGYNQIIKQAKTSSAALPTVPRRQLSFQGRLTDSSGTPITTSVNVTFKLWNDLTAGTQLYNSNACTIVPDPNGIFNTLIGNGTCGQEIANTVFTENRDVFLEVIVGSETLTPRQQIATVGYALNSETLQGYPASASATINTIPVIDENGDINISVNSPTINSTSGTFTLNGQALTLTTAANSGGDIVLQPDALGAGQVLVLGATTNSDTFRVENANLTSGALISGYIGNDSATGQLLNLTSGSTETNRFYVAASGQTVINTASTLTNSGFILDQNGSGDLFTASASGVTKFTIHNNGDISAFGSLTGLTGLTVSSGTVSLPNGEINNSEISELDWNKLQNYPSACPAGQVVQAVGDTLSCVDMTSQYWQRTDGSLAPQYITDSLNLGSTATNSALVHLAGTLGENSWINTGTGNFGIGTTAPSEKLDINGAIRIGNTTTNNAGTLRYTANNNLELYDGTYWATLNTGKYTKEITGFVDRTSTTLSFTNTSPDRTFTITGTNFPVFIKSQEFIKNTESIQISNTIGLHYIYYNSAGTLTESTLPWDIETTVQIATIYWNGTTGLLGDERHGVTMDNKTHEYLHKTVGTRYDTGLGGTFTNTTFSIDPGSVYDEDLKHTITPAQTTTRVFYRIPAATSFTYTSPQTAYYTASTGTLDYDNAGTRTAVASGDYVAYWVFATNDATTPIYTLMGQRTDGNLTNARNNNNYQSLSLSTLPFAEMKLLYRVLLRNIGGTVTYIETQDQRNITNLPSGTYIATAHGTLTGLLNDDHTQYALLAGRALGQTLIGGDAANETLTLQGNAGATGNTATSANLVFKVGDAGGTTAMTILNNGNIGMGLTNPSYKLDITGDINLTGGIRAGSTFGVSGQVLSSTGTGLAWIDAAIGGNSSPWNWNTGVIYPFSITDAVNLGNAATNSATVHLAGTAGDNSFINTGNFGIGTTNPLFTLDVTGDINLTGGIRAGLSFGNSGQILSSTGTGIAWIDAVTGSGNNYWQENTSVLSPINILDALNLGSTATNSATVHLAGTAGDNSFINTGNFGIGTTNPTSKLYVSGGITGNLFTINDGVTDVLNITSTQTTFYNPTSFTSSGDVSISYNLNFTNITSSFINSDAPLSIRSGETFNSSDLTLQTYNKGNIIANTEAFVINGSATVSGQLAASEIDLSGALLANGDAGISGQVLSSTGTGVAWVDAGTGGGNNSPWDWDAGVIYPFSITDSINLGNAATASATVHLAGTAGDNSFINTGNFGIGDTTPTAALTVGSGDLFQVNSSGAIAAATGITNTGAVNTSGGVVNINASSNYNTNINTGTSTGEISLGGGFGTASVNTTTWDISTAGAASGFTGISSSGTINFSDLAPLRAVFTDASKNLVSTASSSFLSDSISDETGSGSLVFGTSPVFTTDITTPIVSGGNTSSSFLQLKSTSGVGTTDYISLNVGNNGGTEALRAISNGYVGIGTTTPSQMFQVGTGTGFLVNNDGAIINANGATISGSVRFSAMGTGIIHSDANGYLSSSALNLATDVTGTLPIINGGTNNTTFTTGKFVAYDGTSLVSTAYDETSFEYALTFQNGLTRALNTVEWGGTLTKATTINQDIYDVAFTGSGNFGIGAANPSQKLDVAGFFVVDTGNSRVGIGTTTPAAKLEIAGSSSTIYNTDGDITFNSASNLFDFSGDSLKNFLNATASGQIKLGSFADSGRPTTIGAGSLIYSTTQNNVQYSDGTNWVNFTNYFNRTDNAVLYPVRSTYDSIVLGTTDGSTASAKVRLSADTANNTFFVNPIAIGFTTAMTTSPSTMLQVAGAINPATKELYNLGGSGLAWKSLYLSDGIYDKDGSQAISIAYKRMAGGNWNVSAGGLRIGDINPISQSIFKLEVVGDASVSGSMVVGGGAGKMDVGTVDPPYTINGEKYATYMASMIGVKEETVGKITTTEDSYIEGLGYRTLIDLDQQAVGSDIWLFSKTTSLRTHINDLAVLLTAEGQAKAWYEVDKTNMILAIYSSTPTTVSYRLTAPRFDSANWTNTRTSSAIGLIVNDSNVYTNSTSIFDNTSTSPELIAKVDGSYGLQINGIENKEVSSFMSSIIANLKAGAATINNLLVDNLTIRTKLISPIADIDELNAKTATISGTLYANDIKSQTIDNLHTQIDLLNEKYSTASSILAELQSRYSTYDSLLGNFSEASVSGDPLSLSPYATTSAIIPSDIALDSFNVHTLIANDILANGSIFTTAISAFDTDLFIQPAGDKPVHLLANLMTLYPDGKVLVNGDLLITGTIFAQALDTQTATVSGTLAVGQSTIASESANFPQITTNGLVIAAGNDPQATVSGQTNTNATIGTATITAGTSGISILNNKVTPTTLIYVTPTSDTDGKVLYVKSKDAGVGFTVSLTGAGINTTDISFNYWLVETK